MRFGIRILRELDHRQQGDVEPFRDDTQSYGLEERTTHFLRL